MTWRPFVGYYLLFDPITMMDLKSYHLISTKAFSTLSRVYPPWGKEDQDQDQDGLSEGMRRYEAMFQI